MPFRKSPKNRVLTCICGALHLLHTQEVTGSSPAVSTSRKPWKGTFIYLQALGRAVLSTLISLTREILFGVFLPIILPIFMGLNGILYSFPVADILTFVIVVVIMGKVYRELSCDAHTTEQERLSHTDN